MPMAGLPARIRARTNSAAICEELVSISSIIRELMAASRSGRRGPASGRRTPGPRCPRGTPRARLPGAVLPGPVVEDRVEDLPGELDLHVLREQRRVTEEYVEDQPLVGLRAGLGERTAVREVHAHVPDLHLGAGHLGPEPQRHALVGLDPDHQGVVGQVLGGHRGERQVRGALEHHRDLGDPSPEPLAGAQVERHARPAPGLDVEADRGVGLGGRGGLDALLLEEALHLDAARPAGRRTGHARCSGRAGGGGRRSSAPSASPAAGCRRRTRSAPPSPPAPSAGAGGSGSRRALPRCRRSSRPGRRFRDPRPS